MAEGQVMMLADEWEDDCGQIGFYSGNMHKLIDDIKELKPTVMPIVPRVLNRLYDKVGAFHLYFWICWLESYTGKGGGASYPNPLTHRPKIRGDPLMGLKIVY